MIVIIATPKLFQWACHCRWLYTYTMLLPHFWQVWVFLTPPTDVAGLGALGESFPGNRRAASGVKHKHTHTLTLTQLLTGTFWQSLCSSHQHSVCLHRSLSAELVCVSPLVFTSSAPEGHASWNGFPHIGHYHFMKECRCYLDVFAQPFIKAEGGKEDTCISWSAVHNINGTQESSSLHPAQVTATWKSKLGASYSHSLVLH